MSHRPVAAGLLLLGAALAQAAEPAVVQPAKPEPQAWVEELRAANQARAALAGEAETWKQEHERLLAYIAGVDAERERTARDADEAERAAKAAAEELRSIGAGSDLDALRAQLEAGAAAAKAGLDRLAARLPPGTVPVVASGEDAFDGVVRAVDAAERTATTIAVDVVPGTLAGTVVAVKLLRVAGACAWWVSLDGAQAGVATVADGALVLVPAADEPQREAITRALAIVEGRLPPMLTMLPLAPFALGSQP
jgi:hypothetical protein